MKVKKMSNIKNRIVSLVLAVCIMIPFSYFIVNAKMSESQFKNSMASKGFPASYLDKLWYMYDKHPMWEFVPLQTGLDFNTAVAKESLDGKCTVEIGTTTRLYKSHSWGTYNSNGSYTYKVIDGNPSSSKAHVNTTPQCVTFFMDPRNFLTDDKSIFQFENLKFDAAAHPVAAIQGVLNDTFMKGNVTYKDSSGNVHSLNKSYAQVIYDAGRINDISPIYLASKIIQEVGIDGSESVSGTHSKYPGYYNFFNIGANNSPTGNAVTNGLYRASREGWDNPEKSIIGGASFIANYYVAQGQNTSYLMKYNVTPKKPGNLYLHQYMSALHDPAQSAATTYSGYVKRGTLDSRHVFLIPVYNNMSNATAESIKIDGVNRKGIVNSNGVNTRTGPSTECSTTGYLVHRGQEVTIEGGYRNEYMYIMWRQQLLHPLWYKVTYNSKYGVKTQFVCEDYVDTQAEFKVQVGTSRKLSYTLYPNNATEKPMYSSYDTRIARVDSNGNITGVKNGTTKVIAYLSNGSFDVVNVKVVNEEVKPDPNPNPNPNPNPDPGSDKITSSVYDVKNGYINNVREGTKLSVFKNNINEKNSIKIFNTEGNEVTSSNAVVGTGYTVKLYKDNKTVHTDLIVVKGDVNGDGCVDIADLVQVRRHILNLTNLRGSQHLGGNYDGDSKNLVDIADLVKIRRHILGMD